jgi:hypothetical protein
MTVAEHARRSTRFAARDDPAGYGIGQEALDVAALSALLEDVA